MGAGKSAVGRRLQERSGAALLDMDEMIASRFGISIPEIFSTRGEQVFREAEMKLLRELRTDQLAILVTGGGVVLREENLNLLKRLGLVVWLDADEETLFQRASQNSSRPLLQSANPRKTFSELLEARRPVYARIADIRIDTASLTDDEVAEKILNHE